MKKAFLSFLVWGLSCGLLFPRVLVAQEAHSGFDLRATASGEGVTSSLLTETPRSGSAGSAGFRAVVYPTWKISDNWAVTGAVQFTTRPYFYQDFSTQGYGAYGSLLQASVNYSRVSDKGSILLRAGELSSAFGSFLLRYDDADNPLVDVPIEYGYYYSPISFLGVAGAQLDVTRGKWDARAQFANSSPANPRSLVVENQYGNWAGGAGYTIRQGFRVGVSAYHGPYLDEYFKFLRPGEGDFSNAPATALGLDAGWAHGHTSVQGEVQHFIMRYTPFPAFREWTGYGEVKQVLSPRWDVAARNCYSSTTGSRNEQTIETAAGYRPNRFQLIKVSYEYEHRNTGTSQNDNTVAVQIVTTLHASAAWK